MVNAKKKKKIIKQNTVMSGDSYLYNHRLLVQLVIVSFDEKFLVFGNLQVQLVAVCKFAIC